MLIVDSITFNARDIHIKNNLTTNNSSVSWTLEIIIYDNWNVNSCRRKSCFFFYLDTIVMSITFRANCGNVLKIPLELDVTQAQLY